MNPRLAFFFPHLGAGGVQRSLLLLAEGFLAQDVAVDLVVGDASGEFRSKVPTAARIIDLHTSHILSAVPGLIRYLRHQPPDALLAAQTHANVAACWAKALSGTNFPLVVAEHNDMAAVVDAHGAGKDLLRPLFARLFYPWADAIVAVSAGVANSLAARANLPRDLIHVIYNPLIPPNLETLVQAPAPHPWLSQKTRPVLLAAGRLTSQKDYPTLLQALVLLRAKQDLCLVIFGEGPDRSRLESLVENLGLRGHVDMPGYVDNIYACMHHASAFVLSSAWEGFPSVLVEAMACGLPVISTDCPSGPSEILEAGKHGGLVPVGRPDLLAQAIADILAAPEDTPAARDRALQFTLERAVSDYSPLLLRRQT